MSSEGLDASAEWVRFKSIRNRINNRRKYEEKHYKSEKLDASLDSTADTWKVAKSFMSWSSTSGPLQQLEISGRLVQKEKEIAEKMNDFFLEKVSSIHKGMPSVPKCYSKCREIMTGKHVS